MFLLKLKYIAIKRKVYCLIVLVEWICGAEDNEWEDDE